MSTTIDDTSTQRVLRTIANERYAQYRDCTKITLTPSHFVIILAQALGAVARSTPSEINIGTPQEYREALVHLAANVVAAIEVIDQQLEMDQEDQ